MNEGKPTRAKWWSRPRPQSPGGQESGRQNAEGDFELARPVGVAAEESAGGPSGTPDGGRDDGDYELSRPVGEGVPAAEAETAAERKTASDTVAGSSGESAEPGAVVEPVSVRGHVESARPVPPGEGVGPVAAAEPVCAQEPPEPDPSVPSGKALDPAAPLPSAIAERPRPLHDPDPYSTPPYGEPGPWAPAPPVQHPAAATPAHGTALPAPGTSAATPAAAPAPGMPARAAAPDPGMPAPAVPVPAPGASAPAPGATVPPALPLSGGSPAQAAPTPPTSSTNPWHRYDPWSATPLPPAPTGPLQQTGAAVLTERQRRKRARKTIVGGALVLALVSGVLGGVVGVHLERNGGFDGVVELPQASAEPTGRDAGSVAGIAARALPSVVTLHVTGSQESGTGTGFVIDSLGHILTNHHVVEPAGSDGEISVVFNGGQTAKGKVVGGDSGYDLAVVKVTGVQGLKPLYLGNSDNVQVGDPVVAIGAPFDLEGTVTSGIISAKERPITAGGESGDGTDVSYVDALQTDAPINPGNSGGPLLDAQGHVIGINSAIRSAADGTGPDSGQAGSIGLGFAIPINQGKRVAEELINTGKATHPVIGVTLDMDYAGDGARVGTKGSDGGAPVTPGGPGDRAGIQAGDVITAVDGRPVHSGEELIVKTRAHRPGDRLELTIERAGEERTLSLVLGSSD